MIKKIGKKSVSILVGLGIIISMVQINFAAETHKNLSPQISHGYARHLEKMGQISGLSEFNRKVDAHGYVGNYGYGLSYARLIDFDANGVPELYTVTLTDLPSGPTAVEKVWKWDNGQVVQVFEKEHRSNGARFTQSIGRYISKKASKYYLTEENVYQHAPSGVNAQSTQDFEAYGYNGKSFESVSKVVEDNISYSENIRPENPNYHHADKVVYSYKVSEGGKKVKEVERVVKGYKDIGVPRDPWLVNYLAQYKGEEIIVAGAYEELDVKINDIRGLIKSLQDRPLPLEELPVPQYNPSATHVELQISNRTSRIQGNNKLLDVAPNVISGSTMVPIRFLGDNFNAQVGWQEASQEITLSLKGKEITLTIGSNMAVVNGKKVKLDTPPIKKDGRSLVPLRFVSENLALFVRYTGETKTIQISDEPII